MCPAASATRSKPTARFTRPEATVSTRVERGGERASSGGSAERRSGRHNRYKRPTLAPGARATPAGAAGLGTVRLGQLGLCHHDCRRRVPHLLRQRRGRRPAGGRGYAAVCLHDVRRPGAGGAADAGAGRSSRLPRCEEAAARHIPGAGRCGHGHDVLHRTRRVAVRLAGVRVRQRRLLRRERLLQFPAAPHCPRG